MCSAHFQFVGWVSLRKDLFEKSELNWVGILKNVSSNRIERSHVHVTVRVEVVDKFDLVDVLEDEFAHGFGFWFREGVGSTESL